MIPWLEADDDFPPVETALTAEQGAAGLLAAGVDLSATRLLQAYRRGIFPWFSPGQPVLWWSTDPRMVLRTDAFVVSDSLLKRLRKFEREWDTGEWSISFDRAFGQVMQACAEPRGADPQGGTWIVPAMIKAYSELHAMGCAHSVEIWHEQRLVGGLYGVSLGRMFFGESMFSRERDVSKIALAYLVDFLSSQGVSLIDCQQETGHLASLGAKPMARTDFLQHVGLAIEQPVIEDWRPGRMVL